MASSPSQGELGVFERDYNNDGRLDLMLIGSVLPEPGVTVQASFVFLNLGPGGFSRARVTVLDQGPDNTTVGLVTPGEVDGDGIMDLVGVFVRFTPFLKNLVTYRGNGDGTFGPAETSSPQLVPDDASYPLVLGDVTGDGVLDVVAQLADMISVLRGLGAGDLNLDGAVDLVTSDLLISLNDGAGGFAQVVDVPANAGVAAVADYTQDGKPDIASVVGSEPFCIALHVNATPTE